MDFSVDPGQLRAYSKLLERNSGYLAQIKAHFDGEMVLESSDGVWIQTIIDAHDALVARTTDSFAGGVEALAASATELNTVAGYYESTDQAAAANLDASMPSVDRPDVGPPGESHTQAPGARRTRRTRTSRILLDTSVNRRRRKNSPREF